MLMYSRLVCCDKIAKAAGAYYDDIKYVDGINST